MYTGEIEAREHNVHRAARGLFACTCGKSFPRLAGHAGHVRQGSRAAAEHKLWIESGKPSPEI